MSGILDFKLYKELDGKILDEVSQLEEKVFPKPLTKEKIKRELSTKHNISIFIAYLDGRPIAYKIGFERSGRIYYSWIGGVVSEKRGRGIATKLMSLQHMHAKKMSYKVICTQTDNSFRPMLILNLKSGFDIKGTIQSTGDNYVTIVLEKNLE